MIKEPIARNHKVFMKEMTDLSPTDVEDATTFLLAKVEGGISLNG